MKRDVLALAAMMTAGLVASCESPEAPSVTDGQIVLRFQQGGSDESLVRGSAGVFDSVVVNVFRPGTPLRLEASRGAAVASDDSITISVGCVAENGKQVSVDLYIDRYLAYHGADPDVNVIANRTTPVTIEVSAFYIPDLTLTPAVIPDGAAFTLHWPPAPAATTYRLEESATLDFATIASAQSVTDTTIDVHVGTGSHYFRVLPMTAYAAGPVSPTEFGYVAGGSYAVQITSVDAAVIPGETITISGENLDFPGTQATIGTRQLTIESAAWGQLVARAPRNATTAPVTVSSTLGSDTSKDDVVVQRVAYVNSTGEFAASYVNLLADYADDFGQSGVVPIPVADLDTRDMSVFDIIIVANDTGDAPIRWAGKPSRYSAITTSGAGVLALGQGGASFMRLAVSVLSSVPASTLSLTSYYVSSPSAKVFTEPHSVSGGVLPETIPFCAPAQPTVALSISNKPGNATFYAETGLFSNQWVIADFQVSALRYLYWGFGGDPDALTSKGEDFLGNAMSLLFTDRPVIPAD